MLGRIIHFTSRTSPLVHPKAFLEPQRFSSSSRREVLSLISLIRSEGPYVPTGKLRKQAPQVLLPLFQEQNEEAGGFAWKLLELLKEKRAEAISAKLYALTIEGLLMSETTDNLDSVENLLAELLENMRICSSKDENEFDQINSSFALVVHALLRSGHIQRAGRHETAILNLYQNDALSILPNTTAMNARLGLMAARGDTENLLALLTEMLESRCKRIEPNHVSFNKSIHAFAIKGKVAKAEEILRCMRNYGLEPDTVTMNSILEAHANNKDGNVEALLNHMEESETTPPDSWSYTVAINLYSKLGDAFSAKRILKRLVERRVEGFDIELNAVAFASVIDSLSRSRNPNAPEEAEQIVSVFERLDQSPSTIIFNSLLNVWAKSKRSISSQKALDILSRMKSRNVPLNTITYNTILSALSNDKQRNNTSIAMSLLEEMKELSIEADTITFNALLNIIARSKQPDLSIAERVFASMNETTGTKPTVVTYNVMMRICSFCSGSERAQALLAQLEGKSDDDASMRPTVISYTSCLSAIASSRSPDKVGTGKEVFRRLKEASKGGNTAAKPNTIAYNEFLKCHDIIAESSTEQHRKDVIEAILGVLREMQGSKSYSPNHTTYAIVLRLVGTLGIGEKKIMMLKDIFSECCEAGLASQTVFRELEAAVSNPSIYSELVPSRIPPKWQIQVGSPKTMKLSRVL